MKSPRPEKSSSDEYDEERWRAQQEKISASMELTLHGVPTNREARRRMEKALGFVQPTETDDEYDLLGS